MLQVIRRIYRSIVPQDVRRNRALQQWEIRKEKLRNEVLRYYESRYDELNLELRAAVDFLRTNPLGVFPSSFAAKYHSESVDVLFDDVCELRYVMCNGYKLYYKRGWSEARIRDYHNGLLQEQDIESPHRYLTNAFDVSSDDVVTDVGAAEGIFALSIIDRVKQVYMFETDEGWLEALRETFKPFGDKAVIIHQAVSDRNDANHTTLDSFFENKQLDFIKMDVDGGERAALRGASRLLSTNASLRVALCAYHNQQDEEEFTQLLQQHNFKVEAANGYMIFYFDKTLAPPYFRRGVLRATKKS